MPIDDTIFFYVNGRECHAGQQYSKLSLNEYLLQQTRWKVGLRTLTGSRPQLTFSRVYMQSFLFGVQGTKLSCGEGGCGACAVHVTNWHPDSGTVMETSINSCLCPVGSLDGVAVTSIEGLGSSLKGFHLVQGMPLESLDVILIHTIS